MRGHRKQPAKDWSKLPGNPFTPKALEPLEIDITFRSLSSTFPAKWNIYDTTGF
jgi:hypothetical protein